MILIPLKISWTRHALRLSLISLFVILLTPALAFADTAMPELKLTLAGGATEPEKVSVLLEIVFLLTILSLAPAIVLTATSFTRIIIVFHFLRQALGIQTLPPNQILASLAIFMTVVIMMPVGKEINDKALQPYLNEEIGFNEALAHADKPLRAFLFTHTREKDLSIFYSITKMDRPKTTDSRPDSSSASSSTSPSSSWTWSWPPSSWPWA